MPELQPRANTGFVANIQSSSSGSKADSNGKVAREAEEKRRREERKGQIKWTISYIPTNESATAPASKLAKPSSNPSPPHSRIHSHQIYPNQPSPSPSQLNNPGIYAAPRPPQHSYPHLRPQPGPPPLNGTPFYSGNASYTSRPPPTAANLNVPGALNTQSAGAYPGGLPPGPPGQSQRPTTPSSATTAVVSSLLEKFWHKP